MLIGITGRAQHGKDTLGARLVERHGFTRIAFADALKRMALVLNPVITEYMDAEGLTTRLLHVVEASGWEVAKTFPEVRRFLQVLGTEAVRDIIGEDSWVQALERAIVESGAKDVVVTDVRFPNEAAFIRRHNGVIIGVERPNFDNGVPTDHPSEANVEALVWAADYVLNNDGTLADLERKLDTIGFDLTEGFVRGNPVGR